MSKNTHCDPSAKKATGGRERKRLKLVERAMDDEGVRLEALQALTHRRVTPPAPPAAAGPPAADPEEEPATFAGAVLALCRWLQEHRDEVYGQSWSCNPSEPRERWPARKKALYNRAMELGVAVGRAMPLNADPRVGESAITPARIGRALNLGGLGLCIEGEVRRAQQARADRASFADPAVRAALEALPLRAQLMDE